MKNSIAVVACLLCVIFVCPAFAQQHYITIGVPTSLKLIEGYEGNKAAQLAVEEINAKGGVKVGKEKRLLKIESLDIRDGEPGVPVSEALLGIEKLILDKKIYAAVVGNFRSEALLAAMDIYSKYKVINIGTIAMSPKFQEKVLSDKEKYKYSFRNCLDSRYAFEYVSGLMKQINKDFGYNKVFIATQDVLWASAIGDMMAKWFKENGWTVVDFQRYPTGSTDFSSGLLKAQQGGAQLILPVFDMPTSGVLVKQWRSMKIPALMAGFISPFSGPKAWQTFNGDIEAAIHVMWEIGHIPVRGYAPAGQFLDAYKKRWKEEVQSGHGVSAAYDSVYVLANAIERAGTTDPDKVAEAVSHTDMAGAVGRIRFDQGHQLIFGNDPKTAAMAAAFQWMKGKRVVIFPTTIADSKIEKPGWMK